MPGRRRSVELVVNAPVSEFTGSPGHALPLIACVPVPPHTPVDCSGGGGGGTQHYEGSGLTRLGTITVASTSTLEWTASRGGLHIFDDENAVEVDSQRSSGRKVLNGGTYHHFLVNSIGDWTITIRPQ